MALQDELESAGNWLFRWRSFLPLVLFVPFVIDMRHFEWPMHSRQLQDVWELCCLAVALGGLAVRVVTIGHVPDGTSGRNTKHQLATALNTTGIYSIVRHPLYLGNFLMWLGMAMFCRDWQLLVIFVLAFWLYYERIMIAEEAFLRNKFGQEFDDWAARTPAFIPRVRQWHAPSLRFSVRKALRQEYSGFFGLIGVFVGLDLVSHLIVDGQPTIDLQWAILGVFGLAVYLTLRTLKKRTRLLHDPKCSVSPQQQTQRQAA